MAFGLGKPGIGLPDIKKMEEEDDVEGLIKDLSYKEDAQIRAEAARALGVITDSSALEPVIPALKDLYDTRDGGFISDERAVEQVINLPQNESNNLRTFIHVFLVVVALILLLRLFYLLWNLY